MFRTDRNRNPAAIITILCAQAGLTKGTDYVDGDPFPAPSNLITARFLGDPVETTIRIIDRVGYYTHAGASRWTYMSIPPELWATFSHEQKVRAVACHYKREGGVAMKDLFPV